MLASHFILLLTSITLILQDTYNYLGIIAKIFPLIQGKLQIIQGHSSCKK